MLAILLALSHLARADFGIDLHFHLFMHEGMPILFRGRAGEPLRAKDWKDRWKTKANFETLEDSGLKIAVVSLYAHPLEVWSKRNSIREQLDLADELVAANPGWVLARSAREARTALANGKRALVLSIERIAGIIDDEEDLREFIDERGISIVTFLHLTDDRFGGTAFLRGFRILSSPLAWIESWFKPKHEGGALLNPNGLTRRGRAMAQLLIDRGVWIDLTHSSDLSQAELIPMMAAAGHPPLYTHTILRRHLPVERAMADWQLDASRELGGIVGLAPSEELLDTTFPEPGGCSCEAGGIGALAAHFNDVADQLGAESVSIGSDFNAPTHHLPPSCGTGTSLDREGLWNIGQSPELAPALAAAGARVPGDPEAAIERFLAAWERVRPD